MIIAHLLLDYLYAKFPQVSLSYAELNYTYFNMCAKMLCTFQLRYILLCFIWNNTLFTNNL